MDLAELTKEVKDLKENHLTHLYERLGNIEGRLTFLIPFVVGIFGALIAVLLRSMEVF